MFPGKKARSYISDRLLMHHIVPDLWRDPEFGAMQLIDYRIADSELPHEADNSPLNEF